jgi:CheY-like chemotaxis protein
MNKTENRKRPIRTLVVDDALVSARAIRSLLELEERTEVAGMAQSGEEAVELAQALQPDLMLVDLFMPGMSGLEVVRKVRRTSPATRIIVITALGEDMSSVCLNVGAQGFVVKNRLEQMLSGEIDRLFGPRQTA